MHFLASKLRQIKIELTLPNEKIILQEILKSPSGTFRLADTEHLNQMGKASDLDHLVGRKIRKTSQMLSKAH